MGELAPQPRETFELINPLDSVNGLEKARNNTRLFRDAMDRYIKSQLPVDGADAGKCLVRYLSSRQDSPDILKPVEKYVEKLLPLKKAKEFMSGFVGEYAFAHLIATKTNRTIEYPETDEDTKLKADWVITESAKPEKFVQTKVLPLVDEQVEDAQLIYDISNPTALREMEDNLYSYHYKGDIAIGDYIRRAEKMAKVNQGTSRQLIFCLIPSGEISVVSGTFVNGDFLEKMEGELAQVGL